MTEIHRQHEAPQMFDAAKARAEYAKAAGIQEAVVQKNNEPGIRTDVAALIVDTQTGEAKGIQPVRREKEGEIPSPTNMADQVTADLRDRGELQSDNQAVVLVDLKPANSQDKQSPVYKPAVTV